MEGLGPLDMESLFAVDQREWLTECDAIEKYFKDQIPHDLPEEMAAELNGLRARLQVGEHVSQRD